MILLTFSKSSLFSSRFSLFIKNFFFFYQKLHTPSFIKISFTYTQFWMEYGQKSNFFSIFVTNEIFKTFFTIRMLIRYYFINICTVYWNRIFILMKFVFFNFNIINFFIFYPFLCIVLNLFTFFLIHNFVLFSFKFSFESAFWSKFTDLKMNF